MVFRDAVSSLCVVQKLEQGFNNLSKNHIDLKKEKAQLAAQLAAGKAEKAALEKEMEKQKTEANNTENYLKNKIVRAEDTHGEESFFSQITIEALMCILL